METHIGDLSDFDDGLPRPHRRSNTATLRRRSFAWLVIDAIVVLVSIDLYRELWKAWTHHRG